MPNSDNTFGTYHKQTLIFTQVEDGGRGFVDHADATAAKEYIFTTEALAVWDECCTNLQWELQANNRDLKVTFDFGTKGGDIAAADDWSEQWKSRQKTLADANGWMYVVGTESRVAITETSSDAHLF